MTLNADFHLSEPSAEVRRQYTTRGSKKPEAYWVLTISNGVLSDRSRLNLYMDESDIEDVAIQIMAQLDEYREDDLQDPWGDDPPDERKAKMEEELDKKVQGYE